MENNTQGTKKEIVLSKTKHLDLWIILLVVVALLGGTLFTLNIMGYFSRSDGYQEITANSKDEAYNDGTKFIMYFSGKTATVNSQVKKVANVYTESLYKAYLMTDADNYHKEYASICDINDAIGQDVSVDETLYHILQDAYNKTVSGSHNFSIFAAPLHAEWERIIITYDASQGSSDPMNDVAEDNYLKSLRDMVLDLNNFTLTFKENNVVKLEISEAYKAYRNEHEISAPILSLNILRHAYILDMVKKDMDKEGYKDGYLYHTSGIGISLKETPFLPHLIYSPTAQIGLSKVKDEHAYLEWNAFQLGTSRIRSAYVLNDTYRHLYISLNDASPLDRYLSLHLYGTNIVELTLEGLDAYSITTDEGENTFFSNLEEGTLVIKKGEKSVFYKNVDVENVAVFSDSGYELKQM